MGYRLIGNTIAEWNDNAPLIFTIQDEVGPADFRVKKTITIDLSSLRRGYTEEFLLNLKDYLIERKHQVKLVSIKTEAINLKQIFSKLIDLKLFDSKIGIIDEEFQLCIVSVKENLSKNHLKYLRLAFKNNPDSPMFARGLDVNDFPLWENKKGEHGNQIDRILAKALGQASVAHILDLSDTAYAAGKIDIGHYSFAHLAFAVFVRPESYRQIRVSDLRIDGKTKQYFIDIIQAKDGQHVPKKIRYSLNEPLGVLLTKQRQHVIASFGHLVAKDDIDKLALFPARQLDPNGLQWIHPYANQNYGIYETPEAFASGYPKALKRLLQDDQFTLNANALRHTVGTLLAQTGASASTIQAILKHASDIVCKAYVDIAFYGLMKELSEAMYPAFVEHLPDLLNFRSKGAPVAPEKLIRSEDLETGRIEDIGECGKDIACSNAPIVCYSCFRFIPCWDADHSINLNIVQREIEDMAKRGKPFQHMVNRAKTAKNRIILTMNAADRYRDAMLKGAQT